jgi:hypothetical protein
MLSHIDSDPIQQIDPSRTVQAGRGPAGGVASGHGAVRHDTGSPGAATGVGKGLAPSRAEGVALDSDALLSRLLTVWQDKARRLADVTVAPAWAHGEERQGVAPASGCVRSASGW